MTDTDQPHARLFDYFIACGLQTKSSTTNSSSSQSSQSSSTPPTYHRSPRHHHRKKRFTPNSPEIPWEPVILYVYNANKIVPSQQQSTPQQTPMTPITPMTPSTPFMDNDNDDQINNVQLTKQQKLEESEILLQVPRYCYCDLSDLINRYNQNNLKLHKYIDNDNNSYFQRGKSFGGHPKEQNQFSYNNRRRSSSSDPSIISSSFGSTHSIQFEKFSFVFRQSNGNQMYGHCRRIFYNANQNNNNNNNNNSFSSYSQQKQKQTNNYRHNKHPKNNHNNNNKVLLPTTLCLVSSYNFTKLFSQIMDNIITKWIFDDHESIFIFLNNILLRNNSIPPCIGDTFRVSLNKRDDINEPNHRPRHQNHVSFSRSTTRMSEPSQSSRKQQHQHQHSSQDQLNNTVTLKLESTNRQNLKILFKTLSVDNILFIISCILTEQKLIFISSELEVLSECIFGLVSLIYPFKWQYLFCPILAEKYLNFFTTPLPFIIGIKRYLANYYRSIDKKKANIVVIDLDKQNILSSTRKFKHLPNKPCWKLKRELNRIMKKFEYLMHDINDFKIQIQNNSINSKFRYIPSSDIIKTGKNKDKQNKQNMISSKKSRKHRHKSNDSSSNLRQLLQKEMTYDIAKGWDDTPFYNAFLSFFIVFIGDFKKFYDDKNEYTPKVPYHLKNIKKNKKKLQQQQEEENKERNKYNKNNDKDKKSQQSKLKQIFYTQEALDYLSILLQTELFKKWYERQLKEYKEGDRVKLYGVQDIYDFALRESPNFGGLSYTGCYEYLSTTFNSLNKKLVKYVIDTVFEFTENTDCTRNTNMIDLMISSAATEPYTFNAIINTINYRLYNMLDNNGSNHAFALMSFYLLMKLMEQSTEKIIMHCIDKYIYFAYILNKYYFNDNNVIKKQMKHITNKFIQLTSNINELKRIRTQNHHKGTPGGPRNNHSNNNTPSSVSGQDQNESFPVIEPHLDPNLFSWNKENDNKELDIIASSKKLYVILSKLSTYDFGQLNNMDPEEQVLIINEILTPPKNIHSYHIFTKMSQYQVYNAQDYRKRATKQEVRTIPPFNHLHNQFAIDIYGHNNMDIINNMMDYHETKQHNDDIDINIGGITRNDNNVNDEFDTLSDSKLLQRLQKVAPINSNTHNIMSPEIDVISPRKHASASIWELPHVQVPKQSSIALQESASISMQSLTPTPPPPNAKDLQTPPNHNNKSKKSVELDLNKVDEMAINGALASIQNKRSERQIPRLGRNKNQLLSPKRSPNNSEQKEEHLDVMKMAPPMINVDLNNTDRSKKPNEKRVKWKTKNEFADLKDEQDDEDDYEPSADSTELDMTPQPTEPYYMVHKFKNPNNIKHGQENGGVNGSDPEDTSFDVMTLGSGDDAEDHEPVDDLDDIPISKFNDDGVSVKSFKSTKTSKWEEESLDLDSHRGHSLSRKSLNSQLYQFQQPQRSPLGAQESYSLDIGDDKENNNIINLSNLNKLNNMNHDDQDEKNEEEKMDNMSGDDSPKDDKSEEIKKNNSNLTIGDFSPTNDVNISPPTIMFQQVSTKNYFLC